MTAKDAVEALMASNPKHPLLRALKKEGILNEILYTEEERQAIQASREKRFEERDRDRDFSSRMGGREGGARVRSIAVTEPRQRPQRKEMSIGGSSDADSKSSMYNSERESSWGAKSNSNSVSGAKLNLADSTDDWLSSYLDTNLDSFSATNGGKARNNARQVDADQDDADFDE